MQFLNSGSRDTAGGGVLSPVPAAERLSDFKRVSISGLASSCENVYRDPCKSKRSGRLMNDNNSPMACDLGQAGGNNSKCLAKKITPQIVKVVAPSTVLSWVFHGKLDSKSCLSAWESSCRI